MNIEIYDCGGHYTARYQFVVRRAGYSEVYHCDEAGVYYYMGRDAEDWRPGLAPLAETVPVPVALAVAEIAPDARALREIHQVMDGAEWTADTLETIAEIIEYAGRTLRDAGEAP